jgi:hypothetical protein
VNMVCGWGGVVGGGWWWLVVAVRGHRPNAVWLTYALPCLCDRVCVCVCDILCVCV